MRFNIIRPRTENIAMIASVFLLAITLIGNPMVAHAEGLPKSFISREDCVAKVSASPPADIIKYGQERAKNRTKTITDYKKHVNTRYATYEKNITAAQAAYKKKVGSDAPSSLAALAKSHKAQLLKELDDSQATVNTLKTEIESPALAADQAQLANRVCGLLYDVRIYSYFSEKMKTQHAVDGLYNLNAINNYQRESVVKLYEKNSSKEGVKSLKSEIDKLPNPADQVAKIDALQPKVDAVTVAALNAQPTAQPFKDVFEAISVAKKSIADDRGKIKVVSAKLTSALKKKPAKKASSSSSSSSSSSPSASSPSESTSSSSAPKKTTAKKTSKKALKCKKGMEVMSIKGKDKCVTTCNSQEVRSARNPVNCVCPQDFRRPPGKPRDCVNKASLSVSCPAGSTRLGDTNKCGKCQYLKKSGGYTYTAPTKGSNSAELKQIGREKGPGSYTWDGPPYVCNPVDSNHKSLRFIVS